MKTVDQMSDAELKAELQRRKKEKEEAEKPKLLEKPDLIQLISTCQGYIDEADKEGRVDEDMTQYIFEAAMQALYGKDVFKWINKKLH